MERVPTDSRAAGTPIVYAGRFADRVAGSVGDCPVLDDWDVLPADLTPALRRADALVIADPFSFPFEAMTPEQWDVPLIVVLPEGYGANFLAAVLGAPLFERLTFFDRVAAPGDSPVFDNLRRRYRWTGSQHMNIESERPEEALAEVCAALEAEFAPRDKATYRVQRAALEPQFAAARGERAADVPFDVLEVCAGDGRWAASFDPAKTGYFGVDLDAETVAAALADFPESVFERLGPGLILPYADESFDLVFTVAVMHRNPSPARETLLSEMWRVAKPGGRLLFFEEFVSDRSEEGVYPISVNAFVGLLLQATNGQVVLEHMESVRYPGEDLARAAVMAVSRLGVPKKW